VCDVRQIRVRTSRVQRRGNHVHLVVNFQPTVTISRLVNNLKGVSLRRLRQEFLELARHYLRPERLSSASCFADSVGGAPISCASTSNSSPGLPDGLMSVRLHHRPKAGRIGLHPGSSPGVSRRR
jgi:hypothetical protein